jgi:hypothetical protein
VNDKEKALWVKVQAVEKKGEQMKLIDPERLIEDKGFFVESDYGYAVCVVAAQDIRNAPAVNLVPVVPGHTDQHNLCEMAYNNGYDKGYEDGKNSVKHGHWIVRGHKGIEWVECSECHVCGSPNWKVCPVCETKMVVSDGSK